jgi:hypothetical protein
MPKVPRVTITRTSAYNTGGKSPDLQVSNVTATGFRVIARPYDGSTWSAGGNLTFVWRATC